MTFEIKDWIILIFELTYTWNCAQNLISNLLFRFGRTLLSLYLRISKIAQRITSKDFISWL